MSEPPKGAGGTSYYLFYTPDKTESRPLGLDQLNQLLEQEKGRNWVIYCEKIWVHADELRKFEAATGRRVRPMLVPFQLK